MTDRNRLIDALPATDRDALLRALERVDLPLGTELYAAQAQPRFVHFLLSGLASNVITLSEGQGVEVGVSTRDGAAESLHLLGPGRCHARCFMQMPGVALRIDLREFTRNWMTRPAIATLIYEYAQFRAANSNQLVLCNCLHTVERRLARWLLQSADTLGESRLGLTQEFVADMLGARRSTVTLATGSLERQNLIEHRRGLYLITDRAGLERVACECYRLMRDLQRDLYQTPTPSPVTTGTPQLRNGSPR